MNAFASVAPALSATPAARVEVTDAEAVMGTIAGNREMFEIIVRRYNTQLYRAGMAYLRDHAQTEDAMQNTYLKAFTNLRQFKGTSAFASWLTRIMINECLMMLRSRRRFREDSIDDDRTPAAPTLFAAPVPDPIHVHEMKTLLEQCISQLPRSHRAVYLLREIQHFTTAETAACLGLSRENVKVCLHRAREGLKAQLLKSSAGVELFDYPAQFCDPMTARVMLAIHSA
jgi:RNA polymerase sigma-70 factor (ECF subfamily)